MPAPRMAGAKTLKSQPAALEGAIFLNGLEAVGAAGGSEAALGAKEWRYGSLVKADDSYEYYGEQLTHPVSFLRYRLAF